MENPRLVSIVRAWKESGSRPQEAFDWSRSRANWQRDLADSALLISKLPDQLDRNFLRELISDIEISPLDKFASVMIWGYGDLGYGSYRVKKMFSTPGVEEKISQVFEFCQNGNPLAAYKYLAGNRITQLGPAFGTKLISFFTPREVVAPIYDSFIWKWMDKYSKEIFERGSCSSEVWSLKIYSTYLSWMGFHSEKFNILSDDLELVIFRDALDQFSRASDWSHQ